jgi:hypothetical protein
MTSNDEEVIVVEYDKDEPSSESSPEFMDLNREESDSEEEIDTEELIKLSEDVKSLKELLVKVVDQTSLLNVKAVNQLEKIEIITRATEDLSKGIERYRDTVFVFKEMMELMVDTNRESIQRTKETQKIITETREQMIENEKKNYEYVYLLQKIISEQNEKIIELVKILIDSQKRN